MITELVLFDLTAEMTRERLLGLYRETAPGWRGNSELLSKAYLLDPACRLGGGVYTWPDRDAAARWHGPAWRAAVAARFGAAPRTQLFDTPLLVDNVAGRVTEAPPPRAAEDELRPRELVGAWLDAFGRQDAAGLAILYDGAAVLHPAGGASVAGRDAIEAMFAALFTAAERSCLVENLFEAGDHAILEWQDAAGQRGCEVFHAPRGRILRQRGYRGCAG